MQRRFFILVFLMCLFASNVFAYKQFLSTVVGITLANKYMLRGATFVDNTFVSPFIYLGFFDEHLLYFGNKLELQGFLIGNTLRGRTKFHFVNDEPAIKTEALTFRNSRQATFEWVQTLELFIPDNKVYLGEVDLVYAQDLDEHHGAYLEGALRVTIGKWFFRNEKPLLQPQLFVRGGWGSAGHNEYLYGPGANVSGFNYLDFGLMVISPAVIDSHFPLVTASYFQVLNESRSGSLVADLPSGFLIKLLIVRRIFDV